LRVVAYLYAPRVLHPLTPGCVTTIRSFKSLFLFDPNAHLLPDVFEKIVTPYDTNAFDRLLQKHKLDRIYPELTFNLRQGFPLGKMPALTQTTIIPNHMSVSLYPDEVASYLKTEVDAGRMSGPFSKEEIE